MPGAAGLKNEMKIWSCNKCFFIALKSKPKECSQSTLPKPLHEPLVAQASKLFEKMFSQSQLFLHPKLWNNAANTHLGSLRDHGSNFRWFGKEDPELEGHVYYVNFFNRQVILRQNKSNPTKAEIVSRHMWVLAGGAFTVTGPGFAVLTKTVERLGEK